MWQKMYMEGDFLLNKLMIKLLLVSCVVQPHKRATNST